MKEHVLLPMASELDEVDAAFRKVLTADKIQAIVSLVPDAWLLTDDSPFATTGAYRQAYATYLETRISHSEIFVKGAKDARG